MRDVPLRSGGLTAKPGRKHVSSRRIEAEHGLGGNGAHRDSAIDVRKERAAARDFPLHAVAQRGEVDHREDEVILPGEMFRRRLSHLIPRGEVDIAIGNVHRRAGKVAIRAPLRPLVAGEDLEGEEVGHVCPPKAVTPA